MGNGNYQILLARAAEQHGVFTRADAVEMNIPRSTLAKSVKLGRFIVPAPGVFVVAGSPNSTMQRMAVAVASMPSLAAISHETAAEVWGLTHRGIRRIHVVTTRWDRVARPDLAVHESLDLVPEDVVVRHGIATTTAERTVVDLGATKKWLVERALEEGIRRGLFSPNDVAAVVDRVGRRGRRGVGVIRPLLKARRRWDCATESALEDLFRKTVAEMDLPLPRTQYVLRDESGVFVCRSDFAYPQHRVLIELDSEAHHMDRMSFRRDRSKQNSAIGLGWTVLRFTWWDLQDDPYQVAAHIRAALATRQTH